MLDERLAQSSPCIIITFSITLYRCLFFHKFSSPSRSDHVENNNFHAWRMKLSFHQVFMPTDSDRVSYARYTPALQSVQNDFRLHVAQCFCNTSLYGSSNSSILDELEPALDRVSDFQLFLP
jgi:hypothetical protein